jgi:hypothetical protein
MARLSLNPEYVASLLDAGFRLHVVRGLLEFEVYIRKASGRWFLQAQIGHDGHLDVGLTQDAGWGSFIGPIHRASSASALGRALPEIIRSLEALAAADYRLRCPRCDSWTAMRNGRDGPVLTCSRRGSLQRPADDASHDGEPCRGTLPLPALHVHDAPSAGGALPRSEDPDALGVTAG